MHIRTSLLLLAAASLTAMAQARIDTIQNNYSYLLPDNPNYGIARGSIFIIKGANLASSTSILSALPFPTTLDGVRARVTVENVSTDVIWYYVTPGQLCGILPSRTPAGTGILTVTTGAGATVSAPIKVVQSAFGILTRDGSGGGEAAAFNGKFELLSAKNSARPADVLQLFGSGVGPVSGDETQAQTQVDLKDIPLTVEVGGVPAVVQYRGRSIYPGLDQINFVVPETVTPGCAVPITIRTGSYASNVTTLPIATNGGDCPVSTSEITPAERQAIIAAGQFRTGTVALGRATSYSISDGLNGGPSTTAVTREDNFSAGYSRIGGADLTRLLSDDTRAPEPGTCTFYSPSPVNPYPNLTYTYLDGGEWVSVSGPAGTRTAPRSRNSVGNLGYSAIVGTGVPGNYLDPGRYTFTSPGGPDVGPYTGSIEVVPELVWTNRADLTVVDRSQPLTLTWSGGEPTTLITIQGSTTTVQGSTTTTTSFECHARNTDRQFTVPISILGRMQASGRIQAGTTSILLRGSLAIASVGVGTRMTASGLDYLVASYSWGVAQTVEYK